MSSDADLSIEARTADAAEAFANYEASASWIALNDEDQEWYLDGSKLILEAAGVPALLADNERLRSCLQMTVVAMEAAGWDGFSPELSDARSALEKR